MAKKLYVGVTSYARQVKGMYIGVGGVARKVKKAYIGVNGVARLFWSNGLPLSSLPEGALVKINENGSGVNFYLAKHDYESGLNGSGRTLFVRQNCYNTRTWGITTNFYPNSGVNTLLNGTYKSLLDANVQELIGKTKFYYTPANGNDALSSMECPVFLLSLTELNSKNHLGSGNVEGSALPIANTLWIANYNDADTKQWPRTPCTGTKISVFVFQSNGYAVTSNVHYNSSDVYGVRPCFTLPNTLLVDSTPNADGSYNLILE